MIPFIDYKKGIEQLFSPNVEAVGNPIEGVDGRHRVRVTLTGGKKVMVVYAVSEQDDMAYFLEYIYNGKEMTLAGLLWESGLVTPTSPARPARAPKKRNADPGKEEDWDRQGKLIEE